MFLPFYHTIFFSIFFQISCSYLNDQWLTFLSGSISSSFCVQKLFWVSPSHFSSAGNVDGPRETSTYILVISHTIKWRFHLFCRSSQWGLLSFKVRYWMLKITEQIWNWDTSFPQKEKQLQIIHNTMHVSS